MWCYIEPKPRRWRCRSIDRESGSLNYNISEVPLELINFAILLVIVMAVATQKQTLPHHLQNLLQSMKNVTSSKHGTTRRESAQKVRLDNLLLIQATRELDDLLEKQIVPSSAQSSQIVESRQASSDIRASLRVESVDWGRCRCLFQECSKNGIARKETVGNYPFDGNYLCIANKCQLQRC